MSWNIQYNKILYITFVQRNFHGYTLEPFLIICIIYIKPLHVYNDQLASIMANRMFFIDAVHSFVAWLYEKSEKLWVVYLHILSLFCNEKIKWVPLHGQMHW